MCDARPDPRTVEDLIEIGQRAMVRAVTRSKANRNDEATLRAIWTAADWLRAQARQFRQEARG